MKRTMVGNENDERKYKYTEENTNDILKDID